MKILAFAGSSSIHSINKKLVTYTSSFFDEHTVEILDLNDYEMSLFNVDRLAINGVPQLALDFAKKIDDSDFLLISLAENNAAYTTAFKNIFDYISVIPERKAFWGNKPTFLMATSPGARGGASVLNLANTTFPHFGATIVETFSLPGFYQNFDEVNGITDTELANELQAKIKTIKTSHLK
ncbi:NADPH-dependent FMN reductase [Pedobacter sp. N23S346]|uniref:NADPH-dependent FMN reductase n=1 Tax=Pedobacter sp. N23S346 TaxID=3402750 RepID=UPI003AC0096E